MDSGIEKFRREAEQFRSKRAHHAEPWPAQLREFAVKYAARQQAAGCSLGQVARQLGIAETTLWKWRQGESPAVLRPVMIQAEARPETTEPAPLLTLISPRGYQLVGLDARSALLALRELG